MDPNIDQPITPTTPEVPAPVSGPSIPTPKVSFNKTKYILLGLLILLILLSLGGGIYYLGVVRQHTAPKNVTTSQPKSSVKTTYRTPQAIKGTIKWNPEVEEISETPALALVKSLATSSRSLENSKIADVKYYKVGTWLSGKYKDKNIVDAVITISYEGQSFDGITPTDSNYIVRVTDYGNTLLIYEKSSNSDVVSFHDDTAHQIPANIILETANLPDLLYSLDLYIHGPTGNDLGPVLFPVEYNGKTNNYYFQGVELSRDFIVSLKNGYKFFATFPRGQKLFGKDQGTLIPWAGLEEIPYYVEDVDHSSAGPINFGNVNVTKVNWVKTPDLMADVKGYRSQYDQPINSVSDISYSNDFAQGCTHIKLSDLSNNSSFNTAESELVGNTSEYQIYRPTNASIVMKNMYNSITEKNKDLIMSFDKYVQSFPILLLKDNFGEYQAVFRSDYPGRSQGCGKPVIYLYPTQKTNVKVAFSSQMNLTKTEPLYKNGWDVIAYPDGKIINKSDGKNYPYLFWEGTTYNSFPNLNYGTVVKKDDIKNYLAKTLDSYGLNQKERNDFIDYWLPYFNEKPYYMIRFYTTEDLEKTIPEYISPKPNSILRLLMEYQGLDKSININPPPQPIPFQRKGFTVVEWGGIYGN